MQPCMRCKHASSSRRPRLNPILSMATSGDADSQRVAVMALANIAAAEENHSAIISKGGLDV